MLSDPGFWLFGLALSLLALGILGVVLSTRRVPPSESPGQSGSLTDLGSEMGRLRELQAEVEHLRAERDELRAILNRLAVILGRASQRPSQRSFFQHPPARRPQLVASTGDDGEDRADGTR
jgi:hypothetical protein